MRVLKIVDIKYENDNDNDVDDNDDVDSIVIMKLNIREHVKSSVIIVL